jgi:putative membrane protein
MTILKSGIFLAIMGSIALFGCGDSNGDHVETSSDSVSTRTDTVADNTMNSNADEDFLEDAVEANTMEIRALTLGKQKGGKDVKSEAGHMLADHKALGEKVAAYISSKSLTLDDVDTTKIDNDLDDDTGAEFDKAWADKMVKDHERVISMFEDAQDDVKDPELKTMITDALPKLKSHLEMSKKLQEKLDNANNKK